MANFTNVSFAGNSLQTANIFVKNIDHFSLPPKSMQVLTIAHENKSAIPFTSYPNRVVLVEGVITGSSIADLDSKLDTFKNYFISQDQNLDIDYNSVTRRYIATLDTANSKINRPGGLLYAEFSLQFVCTSPFGQDTASTTILTAAGRTLSGYVDAVTFGGTAPYQLPVITITLTAVTGGTGFLFFGNNGNGQGITISGRTFANADVIVIDCTLKTVTVNGTPVNFSGAFPEFSPGAASLGYSDGFTTRTFNITVADTALYL
jgi:hypothetical protein